MKPEFKQAAMVAARLCHYLGWKCRASERDESLMLECDGVRYFIQACDEQPAKWQAFAMVLTNLYSRWEPPSEDEFPIGKACDTPRGAVFELVREHSKWLVTRAAEAFSDWEYVRHFETLEDI